MDIIIEEADDKDDDEYAGVLLELTLCEWVDRSYAARWVPGDHNPFSAPPYDSAILIFSSEKLYEHAAGVMAMKLGPNIESKSYGGNQYIRVGGYSWEDVKDMGMGILPVNPGDGRSYYLRPVNDRWVNREYIDWLFPGAEGAGIIFRGPEVTGYPEHMPLVREWLRKKKAKLYIIEFFRQKGLRDLADGIGVSRLFSVTQESGKEEAIRKCIRGIRERNIRGIYLKGPVRHELADELAGKIAAMGYSLGRPLFFPVSGGPGLLNFAGALFVLTGIIMLRYARRGYLYAASVSAFLLLYLLSPMISVQALALLISMVFPVIALDAAVREETGFGKALFIIFGFSVIAGLVLSGMLAAPAFYVKLYSLRGIKLALIMPLAAGLMVLYRGENILRRNIVWGEALIFIAVAGVMGLYILRSSNADIGLISAAELRIRSALESMLVYRPRFKEFLFGHPLLVCGIYMMKNRINFRYDRFLVLLGLTGQCSVINTFMHIHTPFIVSVTRTAWGMILGLALGFMIAAAIKKWRLSTK
ncbi:MAG: hypothetical protein JXJ19_00785 [Elusimicrobia bacterium]|nr:hypothetical protein [Elusimicrobiota bacterium]